MAFAFFANAQQNFIIEIDGKSYSKDSLIELRAGNHEIIFHFPNQNDAKYYFRLENLEKDWKISNFPLVRYTNLGGGNYVFYGKIIRNNQVLNQFSSKISIKENFWEKWWFWLFVSFFSVLSVSLVIYFWFLYDARQQLKTQQIRQRIAADLHDEVGANLSSISFLAGSLQKKINPNDENSRLILDKITDNSSESATLINDTIWALNPAFDSFEKLLERTKSFASSLLSAKDIAFSVENRLQKTDFELTIEQRRNLFLILKEALNNVAKHSEASKVSLKIEEIDSKIRLSVEDNGKGFDEKMIFGGNGLQNYQLRAIEDEIEVHVVSKLTKGTSVEILLYKNH